MQKKKKKKKKKLLIMRTKSDQYYLFIFQNDQMAFEIENKTTKTNKCKKHLEKWLITNFLVVCMLKTYVKG